MHFGIEVVPFGEYSDPRPVVALARAAEDAGWEAISLWDHVVFPYGAGDPCENRFQLVGEVNHLHSADGQQSGWSSLPQVRADRREEPISGRRLLSLSGLPAMK
jgi:alkanesulfonate monooxygenase SsuD/methylene tetrahydromethanopterin reductase-like flavin-dependent oxidoreductase (luciferase family)